MFAFEMMVVKSWWLQLVLWLVMTEMMVVVMMVRCIGLTVLLRRLSR
jgi:hypothetical protein